MARSEGRLLASIWSDEDFCALPEGAQRMFMFLISQKDLAHCGVIRLRANRWASRAGGLTPQDVLDRLALLERARYVLVDHETEEVLVRTFIRNDRVYRQPNTFKAAAREAVVIDSRKLRLALLDECDRIEPLLVELSDETPKKGRSQRELAAEALTDLRETLRAGIATPSTSPPDALDIPSGCPPVRDASNPVPLSPVQPSAAGDSAPAALVAVPDEQPETLTQRSKRITDAYAKAEPMCRWPAINAIALRAIKAGRWADSEIQAALLRLAAEGRPVTVDTLRVELDGLPPARAAPQVGRTTAGLQLAERLAREGR